MSREQTRTKARPFRPLHGVRPGEVACVEVVHGKAQGRIVALVDGSTLIGRAPSADVSLPDDGVSRHHAKLIVARDGSVTLVDLDSTNGTYLNRAEIERAIVRPGDEIQIGPDATLRFGFRAQRELVRPAVPQAPAPIELSERELEVARLAARGLTNAAIGARLGISARTVGSHLGKIYERLDVHTRAALAMVLVSRKLLPAEDE